MGGAVWLKIESDNRNLKDLVTAHVEAARLHIDDREPAEPTMSLAAGVNVRRSVRDGFGHGFTLGKRCGNETDPQATSQALRPQQSAGRESGPNPDRCSHGEAQQMPILF
jgi:hypothetical protein